MYLLISKNRIEFWHHDIEFTFHYVSIKSVKDGAYAVGDIVFTFHYVSIKSISSQLHKKLIVHIYIPLCIY